MKKYLLLAIIAFMPICYALAETSSFVMDYLEVLTGGTKNTSTYNFKSANVQVTVDVAEVLNDSYPQKTVIAARDASLFGRNKQLVRRTCATKKGYSNICVLGDIGKGKRNFQFGAYENAFNSGATTNGKTYSGFISNFTSFVSYDN